VRSSPACSQLDDRNDALLEENHEKHEKGSGQGRCSDLLLCSGRHRPYKAEAVGSIPTAPTLIATEETTRPISSFPSGGSQRSRQRSSHDRGASASVWP
jgi:hypothetical protein